MVPFAGTLIPTPPLVPQRDLPRAAIPTGHVAKVGHASTDAEIDARFPAPPGWLAVPVARAAARVEPLSLPVSPEANNKNATNCRS